MKTLFLTLAIVFTAVLFSQNVQILQTVPDKATVFLNGAQLFHSKNVQLQKGQTDIIVQGLAQTIDPQSIRAGGTGNFTIMDVQYKLFYPEPASQNQIQSDIQKKIQAVEDSIQDVAFILKDILNQREVLNIEKQILLNNKLVRGEGKSDSLQLIKQSMDYYNVKLNQIYAALLSLEKQELKVNKENEKLNKRLQDLNIYWQQQNAVAQNNQPVPQIIVSVFADAATTGQIDVNYIAQNAGWYATYDLRAEDISTPVELSYKANIWQQTGIDWKNVKLICSTGNPMTGNDLPDLTTWYLSYYDGYYKRDYDERAETAPSQSADSQISGYLNSEPVKKAQDISAYTQQNQTLANTEFEINMTYSIPNDGKGHAVNVQTKQLTATYNYLIVPKVDENAFLIARITDWENASLLPGNVNIYFKNTFVGKTLLNPLALNDTLQVSMGRDKSIEVKRTQLLDKSTDKIIGLNNKKTLAYQIEVRNGKSTDIEIILKDQIPVSQDDDIKVALLEKTGGDFNTATGIITWRNTLTSKNLEKYNLKFEITYPKNTTLGSL